MLKLLKNLKYVRTCCQVSLCAVRYHAAVRCGWKDCETTTVVCQCSQSPSVRPPSRHYSERLHFTLMDHGIRYTTREPLYTTMTITFRCDIDHKCTLCISTSHSPPCFCVLVCFALFLQWHPQRIGEREQADNIGRQQCPLAARVHQGSKHRFFDPTCLLRSSFRHSFLDCGWSAKNISFSIFNDLLNWYKEEYKFLRVMLL